MTEDEAGLYGAYRASIWMRELRLENVEGKPLPGNLKLLLFVLASRALHDGEYVTASVVTLAGDCHMSPRWVGEALEYLGELGLITFRFRSKGGMNQTHKIEILWENILDACPKSKAPNSARRAGYPTETPNPERSLGASQPRGAPVETPQLGTPNPARRARNSARQSTKPRTPFGRQDQDKKTDKTITIPSTTAPVADGARESDGDGEDVSRALVHEGVSGPKAKELSYCHSMAEVIWAIRKHHGAPAEHRAGRIAVDIESGAAKLGAERWEQDLLERRRKAEERNRAVPPPRPSVPEQAGPWEPFDARKIAAEARSESAQRHSPSCTPYQGGEEAA